jgi:hypothetical protein
VANHSLFDHYDGAVELGAYSAYLLIACVVGASRRRETSQPTAAGLCFWLLMSALLMAAVRFGEADADLPKYMAAASFDALPEPHFT